MDEPQLDYYELLGVDPKASVDEIRAAYRKLAVEFHPDRNQGNEEAEQIFKLISQAYDTVSDEGKRKAYDAVRSKIVSGQGVLDAVAEAFGPLADVFMDTMNIFSPPEAPKKRKNCETCRGSGRIEISVGPLQLVKSCSCVE